MTIDAPDRSHLESPPARVRPAAVLAVVLVASLAINVETTIVNVALPKLNSALGASTRGLQWIVDAYNLAFAALVLAGGTIGDKFGRRGTLIAGLVLFALSSTGAALCSTTGSLIAMRVAMGVASALIYPTTLAIITDTFREARQRAVAIGLWGAVTGLGWRSARSSAARCSRCSGGAASSWHWRPSPSRRLSRLRQSSPHRPLTRGRASTAADWCSP